jgi:GNAT superfamily N-acetyltransferase
MSIQLAASPDQILRCFPVVSQLRPHLDQASFVDRVQRQMQMGYQLVFLDTENQVVAIAGFRISECLAWGKFLYVDDLVTDERGRSRGYGQQLFAWLTAYAKQQGCEQLQLDSGVQRFDAHRFYFHQRMSITSYHFAVKLS